MSIGKGAAKYGSRTNSVMTQDDAEHFYAWMEKSVRPEDQHEVEQKIHELLRQHPDMTKTHSWPEMAKLAGAEGW